MILNTTDISIEVLLGGATTTNALQVTASWRDVPSADFSTGLTTTTVNSATAVTVVPAIEGSYRREIINLSVYNDDTVTATVTIRYNNGGTYSTIAKCTLPTLYSLQYERGYGWRVLDNFGGVVSTTATVLPDGTYGDIAVSSSGTVMTLIASINKAITGIWSFVSGKLRVYNTGQTYYHQIEASSTANRTWTLPDEAAATFMSREYAASNYQPLDSDLTTIAGISPSNDDILQRKSGAWTNRTIAQYYADLQASVKDDVRSIVGLFATSGNPADSMTYYLGLPAMVLNTTDTAVDCYLADFDVTIVGIVVTVTNSTTAGTNENVTVHARNVTTATSSASFGNIQTNATVGNSLAFIVTGTTMDIDANQTACLEIRTPAYATNPVGTAIRMWPIIKRR